jgi:hypothetical protein
MAPRWVGVDAARGLALLGMMAAHTWPRDDTSELLVDGRPSVLFAVVAGVALGLVTGGSSPFEVGRGQARVRLLIRAIVLFALGAALWVLPSGIAIILDYYGVMFVLMIPLLFARRGVLLAVVAVVLVAAPLLRDEFVVAGTPEAEPLATVVDYLFTGYYPALLWLPLLAIGLLIARAGLESRRVRLLAVGLGAMASIAGYGAGAVLPGVDASAHSGTIAELLGAGGLAVGLVGGALLLLDREPPARIARLIAAPLSAMGRVPLTVYSAHVVVIAVLAPFGPAGLFEGAIGIGVFVLLAVSGMLFGLAWQALGWRGPLEWLVSLLADLPFRRGRAVPD